MKLKLHIKAKSTNGSYGRDQELIFAVLDLDKADTYPQNFVCVLPRLNPTAKSTSKFSKAFGDQSHQIAKSLLDKALKSEGRPGVKAEIEKRLRALKNLNLHSKA